MANGALAVKNTHGVAFKSAAAGFAKFFLMAVEIFFKSFVIFCSAFGAADGVDLKLNAFDLELVKNLADHCDHFSICSGRSGTDKFRTELVEFTKTACLGFFITEAAGKIACFYRKSTVEKSVFDKSAHASCGTFRAKGDGTFTFIKEGVHFLLNNVGGIANASCKKFGVFEGGETDFLKAEKFGNLHGSFFNMLPFCALFRKNILGSSGRFSKNSHKNYLLYNFDYNNRK